MEKAFDISRINLDAFMADLKALEQEVRGSLSEEDTRHMRRMERWGRALTLLGVATAGVCPNPVSVAALSMGRSFRWMLMHHIGHRGYDKAPGVPERYTSRVFARGRRRFIDWPDWMIPEAWIYEHNVLHHSFTGEAEDPDLLERNVAEFMRSDRPVTVRYAVLALYAGTWKFTYYTPNTLRTWAHRMEGKSKTPHKLKTPLRQLLLSCYLPYPAMMFLGLPALHMPFGPWAALSALINSAAAEVVTNIHTFAVIGPNHAGEDLYRFDDRPDSKAEWFVRQIIGSVNYKTGGVGGDLTDFLQMWLNYQIEHHLWPDLTMLQYQRAQPKVKALCEKHGIPYVQESLFARVKKFSRIFTGTAHMKRARPNDAAEPARAAG